MEDRKRPAISSADELAPPSKRVAVNGSKAKDDALEMKEESWIEVRAAGDVSLLFRAADFLHMASPPLHQSPGFALGVPYSSFCQPLLEDSAHQASDDARY